MNLKTACFACILLLIAFSGFAQGGGTQRTVEERVKMTMDSLKINIALTEAQVPATDSIFTAFYAEMDQLRQSGQRPERAVVEAKINERDEKLKKVFTADQFAKYKTWEAERRERMRAQRPNN